jgi:thiol-disulfide isomerase/thioredoxin
LLVCDGEKLYVYLEQPNAVVETPAPKDLKALGGSDAGRFLTAFPSDIDFRSLLAGEKLSLRGLRLEPEMPVLEGQRAYVLRANFRLSGAPKLEPNVGPGTQTLWIGSRDWLIRRIEIRLPWRKKGKGGTGELRMVEVVRRPRRNSGMAGSVFAFQPGPGVRRVTGELDTVGASGSSEALIGMRAPDMTPARWVQGKIERAGMKGKVVVLDFWATWCLPCEVTLPHLETIFEKNAGRGLLVVGIHTSQGKASLIMKTARQKGLSYPLAIDSPYADTRRFGESFNRYGVHKIPQSFVIDRRGVVRWVGHPMEPGFERAVEGALEE